MANKVQLFICPNAKTCTHKMVWNKPVWDKAIHLGGVQIGVQQVLSGHCKSHPHYETCAHSTAKCPACVPVKGGVWLKVK